LTYHYTVLLQALARRIGAEDVMSEAPFLCLNRATLLDKLAGSVVSPFVSGRLSHERCPSAQVL